MGLPPLQEFGALMSNYSLPPPLPTYHVLLEGEGLGQALGIFKDDLLNVCMRHVEKMSKADLSRSFIERNHMENGTGAPCAPAPNLALGVGAPKQHCAHSSTTL